MSLKLDVMVSASPKGSRRGLKPRTNRPARRVDLAPVALSSTATTSPGGAQLLAGRSIRHRLGLPRGDVVEADGEFEQRPMPRAAMLASTILRLEFDTHI